jgi:hypothetical protein
MKAFCGEDMEVFNVKPCGIYSNHWALEGWTVSRVMMQEIAKFVHVE